MGKERKNKKKDSKQKKKGDDNPIDPAENKWKDVKDVVSELGKEQGSATSESVSQSEKEKEGGDTDATKLSGETMKNDEDSTKGVGGESGDAGDVTKTRGVGDTPITGGEELVKDGGADKPGASPIIEEEDSVKRDAPQTGGDNLAGGGDSQNVVKDSTKVQERDPKTQEDVPAAPRKTPEDSQSGSDSSSSSDGVAIVSGETDKGKESTVMREVVIAAPAISKDANEEIPIIQVPLEGIRNSENDLTKTQVVSKEVSTGSKSGDGDSSSVQIIENEGGPNEAETSKQPKKRGRPRKHAPDVDVTYPAARVYPDRLQNVLVNLTGTQRKWIIDSGWKWILTFKLKEFDKSILNWLMSRWDAKEQVLEIRDDYGVVIDEEMIGRVTGLPFEDHRVDFEKDPADAAEIKELKAFYKNEGGISYGHLHNLCITERKDQTLFMRHFILLALGTILASTKSNWVSPKHLEAVLKRYMLDPSNMNWSRYILGWMKQFGKYSNPASGFQGSALVLLIVYVDRLRNRYNKGLRWNTDAPRIAAWQQTDLDKVLQDDKGPDGEYGAAEVVRDVKYWEDYPIGPPQRRVSWEDTSKVFQPICKDSDFDEPDRSLLVYTAVGRFSGVPLLEGEGEGVGNKRRRRKTKDTEEASTSSKKQKGKVGSSQPSRSTGLPKEVAENVEKDSAAPEKDPGKQKKVPKKRKRPETVQTEDAANSEPTEDPEEEYGYSCFTPLPVLDPFMAKLVKELLDGRANQSKKNKGQVIYKHGPTLFVNRDMIYQAFRCYKTLHEKIMSSFSNCINEQLFLAKEGSRNDSYIIVSSWAEGVMDRGTKGRSMTSTCALLTTVLGDDIKRGLDMRQSEKLYIPVLYENRWSLYIAMTKEAKFLVFDTKYKAEDEYHQSVGPLIREWLSKGLQLTEGMHMDCSDWTFETAQHDVPEENDDHDSGLYVMVELLSIVQNCKGWCVQLRDERERICKYFLSLMVKDKSNAIKMETMGLAQKAEK